MTATRRQKLDELDEVDRKLHTLSDNAADYVTVRGYATGDGLFHLEWTDNGRIGGDGFVVPIGELRVALPTSMWGDMDELETPKLEVRKGGYVHITYSTYTGRPDAVKLQHIAIVLEMELEEMLQGFQIG